MRKYLVYIHTNKINNKKYIGITCMSAEDRWKNGAGYSKRQPRIHNAIKKYGWNNFEHQILHENLTANEAKKLEQELIAKYNTTDKRYGYNMTLGGEGYRQYSTQEEKEQARREVVLRSIEKLNADPIRKEKDLARRRAYATEKYKNLQKDPVAYEAVKADIRERAKQRQEDPIEHEKILATRKRCKQKAMQDPEKKAKILEANKAAKEKVKILRQELLTLYDKYPGLFTPKELEIAFTKFSKDSGCFKYNSAKQLNEILNSILRRLNNG